MLITWNTDIYSVICQNQDTIISAIHPTKDVENYESLVSDVLQANVPDYQKKYKDFWMMNVGFLGSKFDQEYFSTLHLAALNPSQPIPGLRNLCQALYQLPREKGDQALQFSFASKLRHMVHRDLPIFDTNVAHFYLFEKPYWVPMAERLDALMEFYDFLSGEYHRVLSDGLLAEPIEAFKQQFQQQFRNPQKHTDVKIIDWLIFKFVGLAEKKKMINW